MHERLWPGQKMGQVCGHQSEAIWQCWRNEPVSVDRRSSRGCRGRRCGICRRYPVVKAVSILPGEMVARRMVSGEETDQMVLQSTWTADVADDRWDAQASRRQANPTKSKCTVQSDAAAAALVTVRRPATWGKLVFPHDMQILSQSSGTYYMKEQYRGVHGDVAGRAPTCTDGRKKSRLAGLDDDASELPRHVCVCERRSCSLCIFWKRTTSVQRSRSMRSGPSNHQLPISRASERGSLPHSASGPSPTDGR